MAMNRSPFFALLLLSLIWGGSYYFIKVLVEDFGPWTIVFLRSALGLVVIATIMLVTRQPLGLRKMPWLSMAIVALINTTIPWAIIGFSETRISSSLASILNATTPLCSLLLGIAFFRTVSNRLQLMGMVAAGIGVVVLIGLEPDWSASIQVLGIVGMITASMFYGLGSQLSRRFLHQLSAYQATFGTLLFSMLGSGSVALSTEKISLSQLAVPEHAAVLIGLGFFGSGVAYILFYWIVKRRGPEFATMVTYLLPMSSIIWGGALLHESIHWNMVAGLVLILCGVYVASRKSRKRVVTKLAT
jgi:drug/metabolite transporter (DMT)-like permease